MSNVNNAVQCESKHVLVRLRQTFGIVFVLKLRDDQVIFLNRLKITSIVFLSYKMLKSYEQRIGLKLQNVLSANSDYCMRDVNHVASVYFAFLLYVYLFHIN